MMKKMTVLFFMLFTATLFAEGFSEKDIQNVLKENLSLSSQGASKIINKVASRFGRDENGDVRIRGVLIGRWRPNLTYFYNFTKSTNFNLWINHPETGKVIRIKNAVKGRLANHGLAVELISLKKTLFFIGRDNNLSDFDGAYMRGVSTGLIFDALFSWTGLPAILSVETGYVSGEASDGTEIEATFFSETVGLWPESIVTFPSLTTKVNWKNVNKAISINR